MSRLDDEAEDGHLWERVISQQVQIRHLGKASHDSVFDGVFEALNGIDTDLLTKLVDQTSPNVLNHTWRSRFLQLLNIGHEFVVFFVNKKDRATTDTVWDLVVK